MVSNVEPNNVLELCPSRGNKLLSLGMLYGLLSPFVGLLIGLQTVSSLQFGILFPVFMVTLLIPVSLSFNPVIKSVGRAFQRVTFDEAVIELIRHDGTRIVVPAQDFRDQVKVVIGGIVYANGSVRFSLAADAFPAGESTEAFMKWMGAVPAADLSERYGIRVIPVILPLFPLLAGVALSGLVQVLTGKSFLAALLLIAMLGFSAAVAFLCQSAILKLKQGATFRFLESSWGAGVRE